MRNDQLTAVRQPASVKKFPVNEGKAWMKFQTAVRALSNQTAP